MTLHWWMHWFWVTALAIAVVGDGNVTAPSNDSSSVPVNTEATTVDAIINYNVTTSSTVTSTASHNISTTSEKPWGPGMYVTLTNIPSMTHDNVTRETDDVTTMPEVTTTNGTMTVVVSDDRNVSESYREGKAINTTNGTLIEDVSASSASPSSGIDAVTVSAISFGLLVLVALSGATGLVLYRRRYLNRPQTLNDKCSDPDSSGYIDDSTLRENSEEMYSLDNDSFLNSLEAMTIQNYWTDSVKHTKL